MLDSSKSFSDAIKAYGREFNNSVTLKSGEFEETYTGAKMEITEVFSESDKELSIGKAFSQKLDITIYNPKRTVSYTGCRILPSCRLLVGEEYETIPMGVFYPYEVKTDDDYFTLNITAYDAMSKLDTPYVPNVSLPTTDTAIVNDICKQFGFEFSGETLKRQITEIVSASVKETLGYLAGLQGKNAVFDRTGKLTFRGISKQGLNIERTNQSQNGFTRNSDTLTIDSVSSGIEENTMTAGTGKGISFFNPYINQEELKNIYNALKGLSYTPGSLKWFGDPRNELGDVNTVEEKGGSFVNFIVCSQQIDLSGGLSMTSTCSGDSDTEISFDNTSRMERLVNRFYTSMQNTVKRVSELINGARGGIFRITDSDGDGINDGFIITDTQEYPLPSNAKVIVANHEGIGLSTDGGRTYTNAITHDGINGSTLHIGSVTTAAISDETRAELVKEVTEKQAEFQVALDSITSKVVSNATLIGSAVSSVKIEYYLSTSNTSLTGGKWSTTAPEWTEGKYMWQRTTVIYKDGNSSQSDPTCISGAKGDVGKPGNDGTSVNVQKVEYNAGDSATTPPKGSWSSLPVSVSSGKFLWTRITFTDGSTAYAVSKQGEKGDTGAKGATGEAGKSAYEVALENGFEGSEGEWLESLKGAQGLQGLQGPQGEQGIQGPKGDSGDIGKSGATSYFHIKYSSVANPKTSAQMSETPDMYIGTYVDFTEADSNNPKDYTWSQFKGSQGPQGEQGIEGKNGIDGKTSYLHIAYANNATGTSGFSVSDSANKTYIGQYIDFVSEDSTDPSKYSWTLIKGNDGTGIRDTIVEYKASSSGTTVPTGTWSTSIPSVSNGQYLWTRTTITYTTGSTSVSYSVSRNGTNGSNGKSIESITEYYLVSGESSGVTISTSGWKSNIQSTDAAKKYLWNYELITYTDGTSDIIAPRIIGTHGANGTDGKDGSPGLGIESIVEYYALSTNTKAPADSAFLTTIPTMTPVNKYLWNYEKITYTDATYKNTEKHIIGVYGNSGEQGTQGINLLRYTADLPITYDDNGIGSYSSRRPLTQTDDGIKLTLSGNSNDCISIPLIYDGAVDNNETVTLSFEYRGTLTNFGKFYFLQRSGANTYLSGFTAPEESETGWKKYKHTFSMSNANAGTNYKILMFYGLGSSYTGKWIEVKRDSLKLEKGEVAAPIWTPAPQDIQSSIDNVSEMANNAQNSANEANSKADGLRNEMEQNYVQIGTLESLQTFFSSQVTQTATEIDTIFTQITDISTRVDDGLKYVEDTVSTIIRESGEGIEIGRTVSDFKTLQGTDGFYIKYKDNILHWISSDSTHMANAIIDGVLKMTSPEKEDFIWGRRTNGNLYLN